MTQPSQQSSEISNLWENLQRCRKFQNRSLMMALGSTVIYLGSIFSGSIYTSLYQPTNENNARKSIARLESELNSLESFHSLSYQTQQTTRLEDSLQHYKTELTKTIKEIQNDIEKNKSDEEHKRYNDARKQATQYILPTTIMSAVLAGLSIFSFLYSARKENKIKKQLKNI